MMSFDIDVEVDLLTKGVLFNITGVIGELEKPFSRGSTKIR